MSLINDLTEKKVIGVVCDLCGSHKAITVDEVAERLESGHMSGRCCDCGANGNEVSFYYICETPCPEPSCLCHKM